MRAARATRLDVEEEEVAVLMDDVDEWERRLRRLPGPEDAAAAAEVLRLTFGAFMECDDDDADAGCLLEAAGVVTTAAAGESSGGLEASVDVGVSVGPMAAGGRERDILEITDEETEGPAREGTAGDGGTLKFSVASASKWEERADSYPPEEKVPVEREKGASV